MNNLINLNIINDTLVWRKLIVIHPERDNYAQSAHIVRLYKNKNGDKYYIFDHVKADNSGLSIIDYKGEEYNLLKEYIPIENDISIYGVDPLGSHIPINYE